MLEGFAAVDPAANLIYVSDTVSVINGSRCNGTHTSGCTQTRPPCPPAATQPD
jgi:hypothetical protein